MPLTMNVLKPGCLDVTRYLPAFRVGASYVPALLLVMVRVAFVPSLVTSMATPGTTAPLESVTLPVMVPKRGLSG
jgi:hypothetical protein